MRYFLLALLFFAAPVHAQVFPTHYLDPLELTFLPDFPTPGAPTTAIVSSPNLELERARILWSLNGSPPAEGGNRFEFMTGTSGVKSTITVSVELDGEIFTEERELIPASVDLVWEATTYTPPFSPLKPLPAPGSQVRVESFADIREGGKRVPSDQLFYTWYRDGAVQSSVSGRGRSSAVFPAPVLFGSGTISVEVMNTARTIGAQGSVVVTSADPVLVLYENHPIFGLRTNRALSTSSFSDVETTMTVIPFHAPESPRSSALEYQWSVNGRMIEADPNFPNSLTVNAQDSTGSARLSLSLFHRSNIFLSARGEWLITLRSSPSISDPFYSRPSL